MRPKLPAKERKSGVLQFRLNRDERKRLERMSKATGLSFSNIFRLRVLGAPVLMREETEDARAIIAGLNRILERDISEAEKQRLSDMATLRRIAEKQIVAEGTKHKRRKSA
jgi:hypothetical protein